MSNPHSLYDVKWMVTLVNDSNTSLNEKQELDIHKFML